MATSSNNPSLVDSSNEERVPPSTQGELPSQAPCPSDNFPVSETIPGSSQKYHSPTPVPASSENSKVDSHGYYLRRRRRNLGTTQGKAAAKKFGLNKEELLTMRDKSESNDE